MAGYKKVFIDRDNFYKLEDSYADVAGIWLNPMEFMAVHDGEVLGLQTLSLQGVALVEVAFEDLDDTESIGKYTVDPTTNSIIFIVDDSMTDEADAKDEIEGYLLTYKMETLEYYSNTDALYTMDTFAADGTVLGSTQASSTSVLVSKMLVFDSAQDVNNEVGYYYHKFRRALIASA